jgi:hypothetical protein
VKISPVAFVAEAALWVTGAALIAGAAGASWSMPNVDLGVLLARPSASSSIGPSPTPVVSAAPSVADKMQAFFANPNLQFEAKATATVKIQAGGATQSGTQTMTLDYNAGDTSKSTQLTMNGKTSTSDRINLAQTSYSRSNGGAWSSRARVDADSRPIAIVFTGREFSVGGVETKNGQSVHRIEVTDSSAFNSDYDSAQGAASASMTLVFWADDAGTPAAYELSGTFGAVVNGVSESLAIDEQWTFVKTSGVTIKAPK